jgi:hypothetical protein
MQNVSNERIEKIVQNCMKPLVAGYQTQLPDVSKSGNGLDIYTCGCQSVHNEYKCVSLWTFCPDHEVEVKHYLEDATRYEKIKMVMEVVVIKVTNIVNDIRYCFACIADHI